jgi:hypothetical protein
VDGKPGHTSWGQASCTHTAFAQNPWWKVDLGKATAVEQVIVTNRGDCCGSRLNGLVVKVGTNVEHTGNAPCVFSSGTWSEGEQRSIQCNGIIGRYVSLSVPNRGTSLHVCEVEVLSGTADPCLRSMGMQRLDTDGGNPLFIDVIMGSFEVSDLGQTRMVEGAQQFADGSTSHTLTQIPAALTSAFYVKGPLRSGKVSMIVSVQPNDALVYVLTPLGESADSRKSLGDRLLALGFTKSEMAGLKAMRSSAFSTVPGFEAWQRLASGGTVQIESPIDIALMVVVVAEQGVLDSQITASSFKPECKPESGRLYSNGTALGSPLKIVSCTASNNQRSYHCREAFDGIITSAGNGWAYSARVPAWAVFVLSAESAVSGVQILSGVDRSNHIIDDFEIELKVGMKFEKSSNVRVINAEGSLSGSRVQVGAPQKSLKVAFERVDKVIAVKLIVYGTNAGNNNLVLTEISVYKPGIAGVQGAWCAATENGGDYLQITFPKTTLLSGVGIQGRFDEPQWVKSFGISYRSADMAWIDLPETFEGTTGEQELVRRKFTTAIYGTGIRIKPLSWVGWPTLRAEIYTCGGHGLNANFYDKQTIDCTADVWPDVDGLVPSVSNLLVPSLNYAVTSAAWAPLSFSDNYVAHFKGTISIITGGTYIFSIVSDDGARLLVDSQAVVSNGGCHSMQRRSGTAVLSRGFHALSVDYFENGGGAGLQLLWKGPGMDVEEVIPSSVLYDRDPYASVTIMNEDVAIGAMWPRELSVQMASSVKGYFKYDFVGDYLYIPQNTYRANFAADLSMGSAEFPFEVFASGRVRFEAQVRTPDILSQSFFAGVDDSPVVVWKLGAPHRTWTWAPLKDEFQVAAGQHTLKLYYRVDGIELQAVRVAKGNTTFNTWPESNMSSTVAPTVEFTSVQTVAVSYPVIGTWATGVEYQLTVVVASEAEVGISVVIVGDSGFTGKHALNVMCPRGDTAPCTCVTKFSDRNIGNILKARVETVSSNMWQCQTLSIKVGSSNPITFDCRLVGEGAEPLRVTNQPGIRALFFKLSRHTSSIEANFQQVGAADVSMVIESVNYPSSGSEWAGLDSTFRDNFAVMMVGSLHVPADGVYTFWTNSDDGSDLYVGGIAVVKNDGYHGMRSKSGTIQLAKGKVHIRIRMFEGGGGAGLIVHWEGPGVQKQILSKEYVTEDWDPRHLGLLQLPQVPHMLLDVPAGVEQNTEYKSSDIRCEVRNDFSAGSCHILCVLEPLCKSYTFHRTSKGSPACCLKSADRADADATANSDCVSGVAVRTGRDKSPCHVQAALSSRT